MGFLEFLYTAAGLLHTYYLFAITRHLRSRVTAFSSSLTNEREWRFIEQSSPRLPLVQMNYSMLRERSIVPGYLLLPYFPICIS